MEDKNDGLNRLESAIHGKSPEEIYEFIIWLFFRYAKQFTDSRLAIIDWLKGESDVRARAVERRG